MDKEEKDAYQESLKHLWDLTNVVNTAFREGKEEGKEEGRR